jgi:tubby-related protein 1
MGERGPRKMRILIPEVDKNDNYVEFRPSNEKDSMIEKFKANQRSNMRFLFNKPPKWNDEAEAFVLNFHGRVDKPSVKNFQLIDTVNEDYVYLQFGRVGDDAFNMDVRWPMSLAQAFAIVLSSFDFKLACE